MDPLVFPGHEADSADPQVRLWAACKSGDVNALREAIKSGADVNAMDMSKSRSGRRPLNWAALNNRSAIIRELLKQGADLNATNRTGFTAVHHAAEAGASSALKALIEAGADTQKKNRRGAKALDIALKQSNRQVVRLLRDAAKQK